ASFSMSSTSRNHTSMKSRGEYQRVAFARLIVHGARVVFADEPTASLDDGNARRVIELLREHADGGGIVICATHDAAVLAAADGTVDVSSFATQGTAR
ncbi:ABC transporter ATP-binding protein, partial [Brachybacterium muris]|nr:ABC transporter ATP-binding protein [Brachybacterium muris]